jgi:hypothetical protein
MSLETALARISELNSMLAPKAPVAPAPTQGGVAGASFANQLESAMGATGTGAPAAPAAPAQPGQYPHLKGDLDSRRELLQRLETLAARRGETFTITSGHRSYEEQLRLWNNRHNNPFPVARPGTSNHHDGRAADVTSNGQPIQNVVSDAELASVGLKPLKGDAVHVELV